MRILRILTPISQPDKEELINRVCIIIKKIILPLERDSEEVEEGRVISSILSKSCVLRNLLNSSPLC